MDIMVGFACFLVPHVAARCEGPSADTPGDNLQFQKKISARKFAEYHIEEDEMYVRSGEDNHIDVHNDNNNDRKAG